MIAVRGVDGEIAFYPLNLNVHRDGILRLTRAPYGNAALTRQAQRAARKLLEHFDYVGVLTIEFFVTARRTRRQRNGAARAQLRALDHRRRRHQPVRKPRARDRRFAARQHDSSAATRP